MLQDDIMKTKLCSRCKDVLPISDFGVDRSHKIGITHNCRKCRREYSKIWYREHPESIARIKKKQNQKVRLDVVRIYGEKCTCCSESNPNFLSLDHVNNDGAYERNVVGMRNDTLYRKLRREGRSDRYQLLCYNCNMAKAFYGICPHKVKYDED